MKKIVLVSILLVGCLIFWQMGKAEAANWTLTNLNSTVTVSDNTQAGVHNWTIDGSNNLFQMQFWYRVGNTPEASVNTLTLTSATPVMIGLEQRGVDLLYTDQQNRFSIDVLWGVLAGGSSGSFVSDLADTVKVSNLSGAPLDFHLFKYADYDLYGTIGGDVALISGANAIEQYDSVSGFTLDTIVNVYNRWEIANYPLILNKLNDGVATNLANATSPLGPGDVTWALQWDFTLASSGGGSEFIMSEDNRTQMSGKVPEPLSLILLGSGLAGVGLYRRLRKPKG